MNIIAKKNWRKPRSPSSSPPVNVPWEAFISLYTIISIMKYSSLFLLMVCLIGGFVLLSGCTTYPGVPDPTPTLTPVTTTIGDPFRAPGMPTVSLPNAAIPEACINKKYQPDCSAVLYYTACLGPLDCGAGHCRCIEGKCQVVQGPGPVLAGQATLIIAVKDAPKVKDGGTISRLLLNYQWSECAEGGAKPGDRSDRWGGVCNRVRRDGHRRLDHGHERDPVRGPAAVREREQILGEKTLDAGTYTQIRLKIDWGRSRSMTLTTPLPSQAGCSGWTGDLCWYRMRRGCSPLTSTRRNRWSVPDRTSICWNRSSRCSRSGHRGTHRMILGEKSRVLSFSVWSWKFGKNRIQNLIILNEMPDEAWISLRYHSPPLRRG